MTPRRELGRLRTVTGSVPAADITGTVLAHEHLHLDMRWPVRAESDPYRWLDEEIAVTEELSWLRAESDLGLVVDLGCVGMGRNAATLQRISAASRVAVVGATGFYAEPFHPTYVAGADVDTLAERLLAEIGFGMDGTSSLPGVIGEVGAWGPVPTDAEERCVRAAALAARHSGLAVATTGRPGVALLEILEEEGLAAERVAVGRDLDDDPAAHRKIAEAGAYVSFTALGPRAGAGNSGESAGAGGLESQVRPVLDLLEAGHAERLLLSSGVRRVGQLQRYGGPGYGRLAQVLVLALRAAGVDEVTLRTILRDNPLRWLAGPLD